MKNYCFYNEKHFYEQKKVTALSNPLSPFLPNLFMIRFKVESNKNYYFPKLWQRHVDGVITVFDTKKAKPKFSNN